MLVDARGRLTTDPSDYLHPVALAVGCNNLACQDCRAGVRSAPNLRVRADAPN